VCVGHQSLVATFTDDVVFLSPNEPVVVGKAAVRAWCAEYLKSFTIHWDKAVSEFTVAGEWAFERQAVRTGVSRPFRHPVTALTGQPVHRARKRRRGWQATSRVG
jgi:ketosteroid isomerase-like protein